jgi:hypothetical protein
MKARQPSICTLHSGITVMIYDSRCKCPLCDPPKQDQSRAEVFARKIVGLAQAFSPVTAVATPRKRKLPDGTHSGAPAAPAERTTTGGAGEGPTQPAPQVAPKKERAKKGCWKCGAVGVKMERRPCLDGKNHLVCADGCPQPVKDAPEVSGFDIATNTLTADEKSKLTVLDETRKVTCPECGHKGHPLTNEYGDFCEKCSKKIRVSSPA